MKYGVLFSAIAGLLAVTATLRGGWNLLLLWPSLSCFVVALGYLKLGPMVFGKSDCGKLAISNQILLLPFLFCLWAAWYGIRLIKSEPALHQLTENLFIGRRLLSSEFPEYIDHVIDLTSEFSEPEPLRSNSYGSFPILDGAAPALHDLRLWVDRTRELAGNVYIHCAEGHGRTGLFAAALLLDSGHCSTPAEAIEYIRSKRPLVRLGNSQLNLLTEFHADLADSSVSD